MLLTYLFCKFIELFNLGTGKSTTLVSILNALHLRQYQEYYNAIEKIITESTGSETYYEELAALNKAAEVKPRILVCAPSNAGIDNVVLKIMSDKFVDGQGGKYSPNIIRVGAGTTNPKCESVSLKRKVDAIIETGSNITKLEQIISAGRQKLKTIQNEIKKLRARIVAMVECCPYAISADWEIRIDEASFDSSGRVVFVNHNKKTTTFDIPAPKQPHETACDITQMPHYRSLLKSLTKYVERHNNETSNLEKYIVVQNAATAKMEGQTDDSIVPQLETHVLNSSHIVLTTLGSSGGRAVESANKFKVVVIDEAAQSAEPSTLVALLLGSSHAILVGDPQQLPATIFSVSGRSTKYDRSLFQRLEEGGHKVHLLNTQYRMNPVISEFPRHIFYEGMLLDGPNVQQPDYGGNLKILIRTKFPYIQPFNIFDLDSKEEREGTSLANKSEAQLVLQLYRTLDRETDGLVAKSRVAIITPYSQQVSLLHRIFSERYGTTYQSRVEISSVDGFQGREANIVIFSCVRAGGSKGIGFLSDVQRMNVALTRAKHFLFVIARKKSIMVNPYWRKLVGYAKSKNAIIQVPIIQKQHSKPVATLKSSLIKSPSRKKVSFGGEDKRLYDINSNPHINNEEEADMFPDLTKLVPMLQTTDTI